MHRAASEAVREAQGTAERDALSNDNIPAAFWNALPENEVNEDLMAIKALQEESTPEERAETLKVQANELFKRGAGLNNKFFIQQAVAKYGEAADLLKGGQHGGDVKAVVLNNRAQAHLRLGNNRSALNDALAALALKQDNVKAAFRGATAASRLGEFDRAEALCNQGLASSQEDADLLKLRENVRWKAEADNEARERDSAKQLAARAPAKRLAVALMKRGWRIGAPQFSLGSRKPFLDEAGLVHWPVLFIYPEAQQQDVIEDATETDTLQDHLDAAFSPSSPPLVWDTEQEYTRDRVELYYLTNAATPLSLDKLTECLFSGWSTGFEEQAPQEYGKKAARAQRVDQGSTLQKVLQRPDYVVPGVPAFFVVAKDTEYRAKFLAKLG